MKNPITTAKKYVSNANKELGQLQAASETSIKSKGNKTQGNKTLGIFTPSEKEADANTRKQRSEFFGAILQGRRYDAGVKTTTKTVNKVYRPSSDK